MHLARSRSCCSRHRPEIQILRASTAREIADAFTAIEQQRPDALFVGAAHSSTRDTSNWPNWLRSTGCPLSTVSAKLRKSVGS